MLSSIITLLGLLLVSGLFAMAIEQQIGTRSVIRGFPEGFIATLAMVVLMSEILSVFRLVNQYAVAGGWLLVVFGLCIYLKQRILHNSSITTQENIVYTGQNIAGFVYVAILLCIIFTVAWVAAPAGDALSYHLPRIMHWIENKSIAHFPVHNDRQLAQPPLQELFTMHLFLLSQTDRLVNICSFFSFMGILITGWKLAERIGIAVSGRWMAVLSLLSIPSLLLMATSSKNDALVAFIWFQLIYQIVPFKSPVKRSDICKIFVVTALGVLSKGTFIFYALPLMVIILLRCFRLVPWRTAIVNIILGISVALLFSGGFFLRNYDFFGTPLIGSAGHEKFRIQAADPRALILQPLKSIAMHFGSSPFAAIDVATVNAVLSLHALLGQNPADRNYNWQGQNFDIPYWRFNEAATGNAFHMFTITIAVIVGFGLIVKGRWRPSENLIMVMGSTLVGFLIFTCLIKWQIWICRLHLPFFLAGSLFVASVFDRTGARVIGWIITCVLMIQAIPFIMFNEDSQILKGDYRSIAGPVIERSIFNMSPKERVLGNVSSIAEDMDDLAIQIRKLNCNNLGHYSDDHDTTEYILYSLFRNGERLNPDFRILTVKPRYRSKDKIWKHDDVRPDYCAAVVFQAKSGSDPFPVEPEMHRLIWSNSVTNPSIGYIMNLYVHDTAGSAKVTQGKL